MLRVKSKCLCQTAERIEEQKEESERESEMCFPHFEIDFNLL